MSDRLFRKAMTLLCGLLLSLGVQAERPRTYAVTNVRIVTAPGQAISRGTIVLRDGRVEAVGSTVVAPSDAEVIEGQERWTVYPAFIDAASQAGLEEQAQDQDPRRGRGAERRSRPGIPHELKVVHPEVRVADRLAVGRAAVGKYREAGFAIAHVLPRKGVFRGQSAILVLRKGPARQLVINDHFAQVAALESSSFMARQYPSSKMGAVATVRQVLLDAQRLAVWQRRYAADPHGMQRPESRSSDAALLEVVEHGTPVWFVSGAGLDPGRFGALAAEFDLHAVVVARSLADGVTELAAAGLPVLLPLELPEKPELKDQGMVEQTGMRAMQEYIRAPRLPAALAKAHVEFALVTSGMKSVRKFSANLAQVVESGLDADQALAALTTVPARLLGLSRVAGSLEPGKQANLMIVEGDLFVRKPAIRHFFVDGYHEEIREKDRKGDPDAVVDPRGTWAITTEVMGRSSESTWIITGSPDAYRGVSESSRSGRRDFDSLELVGNALTIVRSTRGGEMEITVIIDGDTLSGETTVESPRGSVRIAVEGRRVAPPEGEGL